MPDDTHQSRRVHYSGRVQGVGFRYTAQQIASELAVTGFVRNLPDGRVELYAEGPPTELNRLLGEIAAAMAGYIGETQVEAGSATSRYADFRVTR